MSEPVYVQCTLKRTIELEGAQMLRTTVAWLPARYGKVGKVVRLADDLADWLVTDIAGRATAKAIERMHKTTENQRKASDI